MAGIKGVVVGLVLTMVFIYAIVSYSINFGIDNGSNVSLSNDPAFRDFNDTIKRNLSDYSSAVSGSSEAIQESEVSSEGLLDSARNVFSTILVLPVTVYNFTLGLIIRQIFGGTDSQFSIIFTLISAIVIAVITLYIIKALRSGDTG